LYGINIHNMPILYRDQLRETGLESFPLPGTASALSVQNNAAAILEATGSQIIPRGDAAGSPETQIIPVNTEPAAQIEPVANQALVNPQAAGLGAGLMAWVKGNPVMAAGIAVGAIWLLSELTKGGKK